MVSYSTMKILSCFIMFPNRHWDFCNWETNYEKFFLILFSFQMGTNIFLIEKSLHDVVWFEKSNRWNFNWFCSSMMQHFSSLLCVLIFSSFYQIWNKIFINIAHNLKITKRVGTQEVSWPNTWHYWNRLMIFQVLTRVRPLISH